MGCLFLFLFPVSAGKATKKKKKEKYLHIANSCGSNDRNANKVDGNPLLPQC